jgi:hypothetical protein
MWFFTVLLKGTIERLDVLAPWMRVALLCFIDGDSELNARQSLRLPL